MRVNMTATPCSRATTPLKNIGTLIRKKASSGASAKTGTVSAKAINKDPRMARGNPAATLQEWTC